MLLSAVLFLCIINVSCAYRTVFSSAKLHSPNVRMKLRGNLAQQQVEGNEGLLDTNRMERAYRGTGIKILPANKLKIGIIGAGLAGMITAMELSDAGPFCLRLLTSQVYFARAVGQLNLARFMVIIIIIIYILFNYRS